MTITISSLQPVIALAAGVLILIVPRLLNFIVAIYLILVGLIGLGGGLFAHGTLTASMAKAGPEDTGLALGAWGAVQASAAGLAIAASGILRDLGAHLAESGRLGDALNLPSTGYLIVYHLEIALLFATLLAIGPLVRPESRAPLPRSLPRSA